MMRAIVIGGVARRTSPQLWFSSRPGLGRGRFWNVVRIRLEGRGTGIVVHPEPRFAIFVERGRQIH